MNKIYKTVTYIIIILLVGCTAAYAGNLTPPGSPTKTMKSLSDLYGLVNTGTNTPSADFATPSNVAPTMNSIGETYDLMVAKIGDISSVKNKILSGVILFGVNGSMPDKSGSENFIPSVSDFSIPEGYYDGTTKITGDSNLLSSNIKNGVSIFGVSGNLSAGTNYSLPKTDQTGCWGPTGTSIPCTATGQDGDLRKGFADTRFANNSDGTTTDNATGLIWQRQDNAVQYSWTDALTYCKNNTAGLPGSGWRLPNIKELISIVNFQNMNPSIDITNFPNTKSGLYLSSTTYHDSYNDFVWDVNFADGNPDYTEKVPFMFGQYVRCVR